MKHTKKTERILDVLNSGEPDYSSISDLLNDKNYPALDEVISNGSANVAAKAIICLGLIGSEKSIKSIAFAAGSDNPVLRMAAAQALSTIKEINTNSTAVLALSKLLDDPDIGVRKFALKAVENSQLITLKEKVQRLCSNERNEGLRKLAENVLEELDFKK